MTAPSDDGVIPFAVEPLDRRGRVARLAASIDHFLAKHEYPMPAARLVGEAASIRRISIVKRVSRGKR
jgi:molecular chaperone Hsp33